MAEGVTNIAIYVDDFFGGDVDNSESSFHVVEDILQGFGFDISRKVGKTVSPSFNNEWVGYGVDSQPDFDAVRSL